MEQKPESAKNWGGRRSNGSIITSSQKNKNVTAWPFNACPDLIPLTSLFQPWRLFSRGLYLCFCFFLCYSSNSGESTRRNRSRVILLPFRFTLCCSCVLSDLYCLWVSEAELHKQRSATSNDFLRVFHSRQPTVPPSVPTKPISLTI